MAWRFESSHPHQLNIVFITNSQKIRKSESAESGLYRWLEDIYLIICFFANFPEYITNFQKMLQIYVTKKYGLGILNIDDE